MALVAMCSEHGNGDQMSCLFKAVYLAYFLRDVLPDDVDMQLFRHAEAILQCGMLRAEQGQGWTLSENDKPVIQTLLTLHDRQLATVPAHRHGRAWEQLERFIVSDKPSPLPASVAP